MLCVHQSDQVGQCVFQSGRVSQQLLVGIYSASKLGLRMHWCLTKEVSVCFQLVARKSG